MFSSGFRAEDPGFRVQGAGCRIEVFWVQGVFMKRWTVSD